MKFQTKTDKNELNEWFLEFEIVPEKWRSYRIFAIRYSYNSSI